MKISLLLLITILFSASINAADIECTVSQIAADGEEFRGIGGSSDSNVIAVGHGTPGSFYHYDGSSWTKHADTSDKQLHDVSVVSTNLAYAVAHDGRIMQYNGANWSIFTSPTNKYLTSVWAESNSDLWIVGKENTLHHWDGSIWTDMSGATEANVDSGQELSSSWGNSTNFYALEKDGDLYRYTQSSGAWDKFDACNTDFNMEAKALWSDGAGDVYIAGKDNGASPKEASVFLYNEGTNSCSKVFSSSSQDKLEGIYGSGSVVYAVGKAGLVFTNSSGSWAESTQGTADYKAVWVSNTASAYYAGKGGFAAQCTSLSTPDPDPNPTESCTTSQIAADGEEFRGIGGSNDNNVIAVGHGTPGSFYHYDGNSWTKHADTSDKQLHDVSVISSNLAYAVGHDGRIMQYNGANWSNFTSPSTEYLTSLWAASSSDIWIVGKENTLHRWNGSNWTDMSGATKANVDSGQELSSSWADSSSFYTVEKDGDLYRHTQSSGVWDKFDACNTAFDMEAKALWSDGIGNIFIAGKDKTPNQASVFLYNEGTGNCSKVFSTSTQDKFEGIYGSGSVVYAAGKKGLIATNSSGSWSESTQGSEDLKAVWVSNTGTAYYAGKSGFATVCSEGSSSPNSSCSTIPSGFALYSASAINLTQNIKINGQSVNANNYSPKAAIDKVGTVTTNTTLTLPSLTPSSFPENSSTDDDISNSDITINETSLASYRTIQTTKKGTSITFTGGGPFQINKLETKEDESTINFAAGIYFINDFKLKKQNSVINITSTPVILHIGTKFEFDKENIDVNKGGIVDGLIVYLHSAAKFKAKKQSVDFTGVIYGPNVSEVTFEEENVDFHGAIVVGGGDIKIKKDNFALTLTDADIDAITNLGSCGGLDHFELAYASNGLTCIPSAITLKACENEDCSTLYTEDINITFDPATGWVTNPVTISSGTASLNLQHTTAEAVVVDIAASSVAPTGALQCFANNVADPNCSISFDEAGFILDIPTLTACKPSADATISAVKKSNISDQCVGALTGIQSVNFWSTYSSPTTGNNTVAISGSTISTSSPGSSVDLDFDINGEAAFTVQYDDAGQVQIDAEHTATNGLELTGDDLFVSTPVVLTVYTDENNFECVSADASCNRFKKAGENFDLKVNAACWESDSDSDFRDNPVTPNFELNSIAVIPSLVAPASGSNGSVDVSSFNFSTSDNGTHTMDQAISEVGVFNFAISPSNYFGEPLSTQNSPNIGRFYPDHFEVTNSENGAFGNNACTGFSYSGQPFTYAANPQLQITAYNAASPDSVTQNYTGEFVKLTTADFIFTSPTNDAIQLGANNTNLVRLSRSADMTTLIDNTDGSLDFAFGEDSYTYLHESNSQIAPFSNVVDLQFTTITDSDNVQTQALPSTLQPSGEPIRFGRLTIANAHGSELVPLPIAIQAEYFNGNNWQLNNADQCTNFTLNPDFQLSNAETDSGSLQAGTTTMTIDSGTTLATLTNNSPLVNGSATMTFSAPGEDNQGYVDILSQTSLNHDWLLGDFDNDGSYDDEATGRASFGLFKGSDNIIFRREIY
jgi:MSHA biogenesis protein MshQ